MPKTDKRRPGRSSIGLDIGSSGVRAVELSAGRRGLVVERFAQVGLPLGAVVGGEVVDRVAVAAALKRLWSEGGFTSRRVNLAVSGQRVIVRQAQVPQMAESDFRSALRFQAMELLPIPVEDALLDFRVLAHGGPGGAPGEMTILLAGTHREVVGGQLAALREAALQVAVIDPSPLAAVRVARRVVQDEGGSYAIVDIGADLTVVVVCEGDTIRFSRAVRAGGRAVTALLAQRTGMAAEVAETAKRLVPAGGGDEMSVAVREVDPLIAEIEGSLGFFASQLDGGVLDRVYVTGGASRNQFLVDQLRERLTGEVTVLDVFDGLDVSALRDAGLDRTVLGQHACMAVGSAEAAFAAPNDTLDLLPPEVAQAAKRRHATRLLAAGLAALGVGLAGLSALQMSQVHQARVAAATLAAENEASSRQIGSLSAVRAVRGATVRRQGEAAEAAAGEIDWTALQTEITRALPAGSTLSSLTFGTGSSGTGSGSASSSSSVLSSGGSVSMTVVSSGGEDAVAKWLRAMSTVKGLQGPWVASAASSGGTTTFSGTATVDRFAPRVVRSLAEEKG